LRHLGSHLQALGLRASFAYGEKQLVFLGQAEAMISARDKSARAFKAAVAGLMVLALAGCAAANSGGNANGDPGPTTLAAGETCESIRANLNKLDSQGVPALIERDNSGKKLSAGQKQQADLYNKLLNQYLGARCHV
jgi:hypothetical protein